MSNLNNINATKEIIFVDLVLNCWKHKKIFFYILIPILLISFFLESVIPKKSKYDLELIDPNQIHLEVYPVVSEILNHGVLLGNADLFKSSFKFGTSFNVNLSFYSMYFRPHLESKKNLYNFSRLNTQKYNLDNYFEQKSVIVISHKNNLSLILPLDSKNENFLREYVAYTAGIAYNEFHKDVGNLEHRKLKSISRDIEMLNQIFFKNDKNFNEQQNKFLMDLKVILSIYQKRKMVIEENIVFLQKFKNNNPYSDKWIIDGPTNSIINQKLYTISKFVLPLILSLIIYLLYVLIRLTKKD